MGVPTMLHLLKIFLTCCCFLSLTSTLLAAQPPIKTDTLLQKRTLIIGVENLEYLPFYTMHKGQYIGYFADLLRLFSQKHGYDVKFIGYQVNDLFAEYLKGSVDFKLPDNPYWQQAHKHGYSIVYSDVITDYTDGIMRLRPNIGKPIISLKNMGTIRGFTPIQYLSYVNNKTILLSEYDNIYTLFKALYVGDIDSIYVNTKMADRYLQLFNLEDLMNIKTTDEIIFDKSLPYISSDYSLSTYRHPDIIDELNQFLLTEKPGIYALKEKWGLN